MTALPNLLRNPRALAAAGIAVVAALLALIFLRGGDGAPLLSPGEPEATPTPQHAEWSFRVEAAGVRGPSNRQRRAVRQQEEDVSAVVAAVNDRLVLGEGALAELEGTAVTPDAARAIDRSDLTLGEEVVEALARRREARVGVDVTGARRAVASSIVVVRVTTAEREVRVRYETTLWLERARRGWRVFAFDGDRRRA